MPELTEEQHERVQKLLDHYKEQVGERKQEPEGRARSSGAARDTANKFQSIGIYETYDGDVNSAQDWFQLAAEYYLASARAAQRSVKELNTFLRIPMTLVEGLYLTTLAGDTEELRKISEIILELDREQNPPHDLVNEPVEFYADKYYLARCLAGAVLDRVDQGDLNELTEINQSKPEIDALYGRAIYQFAQGVHNDDPTLVESGIRAMLEHHERTLDDENVNDLIMAPQATALLIIARQKGYDIDVDSEFIPDELVEASASG